MKFDIHRLEKNESTYCIMRQIFVAVNDCNGRRLVSDNIAKYECKTKKLENKTKSII
jgi:hypothetical protein